MCFASRLIRRLPLLLALLAVLTWSACDLIEPPPEPDPNPTPVEPVEPVEPNNPPPSNQDADGDGLPDAADRCPSQPETYNNVFDGDGCPDVPGDLYAAVRADVEQYWASAFQSSGYAYQFTSGFYFYQGQANSACGPLGVGAWYCNGATYYETAFMGAQLSQIGDMAPAFIIAHEIGHHVSALLGWQKGFNVTFKQYEIQADCFGGAWTAAAAARGLLDTNDLQEATRSLISASQPGVTWFRSDMHGTPQQRTAAFNAGYQRGPTICTDTNWLYQFPKD